MDYNIIIILAVVVAGVGGFIVLSLTILSNGKVGSRGKGGVDALQIKKNREEVERERENERENY